MYSVWSCDDIASQHCKETNRCLWLNQRIAMNNDKFTLNLLYWGFIVLMLSIWLYVIEGVWGWRIGSCASDYNICWIFTVETGLFWIIWNTHKICISFIYLFLHFQSDGNTSFLRAARDGNLQEVLEYLKGSTDINTSNPVSSRPLTLKVQGHIKIIFKRPFHTMSFECFCLDCWCRCLPTSFS